MTRIQIYVFHIQVWGPDHGKKGSLSLALIVSLSLILYSKFLVRCLSVVLLIVLHEIVIIWNTPSYLISPFKFRIQNIFTRNQKRPAYEWIYKYKFVIQLELNNQCLLLLHLIHTSQGKTHPTLWNRGNTDWISNLLIKKRSQPLLLSEHKPE